MFLSYPTDNSSITGTGFTFQKWKQWPGYTYGETDYTMAKSYTYESFIAALVLF